MDIFLLDNIPFVIHREQMYPFLKIEPGSKFADQFDNLVNEAVDIAKPKAIYKLSSVEHSNEDSVIIDGLIVNSCIVKINLKDCGRVFPFIATCGTELEEWMNTLGNKTHHFWADAISLFALGTAINTLKDDINKRFETGLTSTMNPGSLEDWPISAQNQVFQLLGEESRKTGVQLTESLLMKPLKSVSGLEFVTDKKFYNCQLCPKDNCSMRRAPYDEHLHVSKYKTKNNTKDNTTDYTTDYK